MHKKIAKKIYLLLELLAKGGSSVILKSKQEYEIMTLDLTTLVFVTRFLL